MVDYYKQNESSHTGAAIKRGLHSSSDGPKPLPMDDEGNVIRPKLYDTPTHDYSHVFGWNWHYK